MEKSWCVEIWGDIDAVTELFYTKTDAKKHFKKILSKLDKKQFTITDTSAIQKDNECNAVFLTNLDEDL